MAKNDLMVFSNENHNVIADLLFESINVAPELGTVSFDMDKFENKMEEVCAYNDLVFIETPDVSDFTKEVQALLKKLTKCTKRMVKTINKQNGFSRNLLCPIPEPEPHVCNCGGKCKETSYDLSYEDLKPKDKYDIALDVIDEAMAIETFKDGAESITVLQSPPPSKAKSRRKKVDPNKVLGGTKDDE